MKKIIILEEAYIDLERAFDFYELQESGTGSYFSNMILLDIEKLSVSSGIHPKYFGYFRKLSSKFPFAIYYKNLEKFVEVHAILDLTRIIHQEIWTSARRHENGGGIVPEYVEQTIYETTQQAGKFRSFGQTPKFELSVIFYY